MGNSVELSRSSIRRLINIFYSKVFIFLVEKSLQPGNIKIIFMKFASAFIIKKKLRKVHRTLKMFKKHVKNHFKINFKYQGTRKWSSVSLKQLIFQI